MTEWNVVLSVFWVMWLADGLRHAPADLFNFTALARRARATHARWHWPTWWPGGWRVTGEDIPFSFSSLGICNRPAATAGRPTERPRRATAWRWEEIESAVIEKGWLVINGARFCRDTGHLNASGVLALAKADAGERERRIGRWLDRAIRPAHLRRRRRVLVGRTASVAMLNTTFFVLAVVITVYLVGNVSAKIPERWSEWGGRVLPLLAGYLLLLHVAAVTLAWRALRRLKAVRVDARGTALFSALMLPPQALRLRALVGEVFFPVQHPVAYALAFGRRDVVTELAFNALADARWPVGEADDAPFAREVVGWFREQMRVRLERAVAAAGIAELKVENLFVAPSPDSAVSCAYCPRCGSQFVDRRERCPQGVRLQAFAKKG